jgi:hypothetical protein
MKQRGNMNDEPIAPNTPPQTAAPRPKETDEIAERLKRDSETRLKEGRQLIAASRQKLKRQQR